MYLPLSLTIMGRGLVIPALRIRQRLRNSFNAQIRSIAVDLEKDKRETRERQERDKRERDEKEDERGDEKGDER